MLLDFLIWAGLSLAVVVGGDKGANHQFAKAEANCACVCGRIAEAGWPEQGSDFRLVKGPGETYKTAWFRAGGIACMAPGEPDPLGRLETIRVFIQRREQQRQRDHGR